MYKLVIELVLSFAIICCIVGKPSTVTHDEIYKIETDTSCFCGDLEFPTIMDKYRLSKEQYKHVYNHYYAGKTLEIPTRVSFIWSWFTIFWIWFGYIIVLGIVSMFYDNSKNYERNYVIFTPITDLLSLPKYISGLLRERRQRVEEERRDEDYNISKKIKLVIGVIDNFLEE